MLDKTWGRGEVEVISTLVTSSNLTWCFTLQFFSLFFFQSGQTLLMISSLSVIKPNIRAWDWKLAWGSWADTSINMNWDILASKFMVKLSPALSKKWKISCKTTTTVYLAIDFFFRKEGFFLAPLVPLDPPFGEGGREIYCILQQSYVKYFLRTHRTPFVNYLYFTKYEGKHQIYRQQVPLKNLKQFIKMVTNCVLYLKCI